MMSQTLFTGMIVVFWLAEFVFGTVVVYWFLTQGLGDERGTASGPVRTLEDRSYTVRSLVMWTGFFAVLLVGIVVGA
ncbi:hypothetical protein [Halococcus agarilyticus]|uniref:hypothetical protein n=1 Tax=Halococcus agarilyticus TaxID=1232219 RepID=UPI000677684A|nr:hypothetical protein [Halococcus agarilyticus]